MAATPRREPGWRRSFRPRGRPALRATPPAGKFGCTRLGPGRQWVAHGLCPARLAGLGRLRSCRGAAFPAPPPTPRGLAAPTQLPLPSQQGPRGCPQAEGQPDLKGLSLAEAGGPPPRGRRQAGVSPRSTLSSQL